MKIFSYGILYPPQLKNEILWNSLILAATRQTFQISHLISVP